ncbi:MAG: hypothetical protein M0C28_44300 [Candidatus Moduliflexus flocculans]|nr:hypothetical protein [Candidatus Moduliflexus flocculans]
MPPSQVNLTFKLGATEALVWAVDLPSQTRLRRPGRHLRRRGQCRSFPARPMRTACGRATVAHTRPARSLPCSATPGDAELWAGHQQLEPGHQGLGFRLRTTQCRRPHTEIYMYTDRPIYRPGQTVYYRGIVRRGVQRAL